jgi:hypothetical protein
VALRDLIEGWDEIDPDGCGLTTSQLLKLLEERLYEFERVRGAILELCPVAAGKLPGVRQLGNKLAHVRGRVIGGKALDNRPVRGNKAAWFVQTVVAPQPAPNGWSGDSGWSETGHAPETNGAGNNGSPIPKSATNGSTGPTRPTDEADAAEEAEWSA